MRNRINLTQQWLFQIDPTHQGETLHWQTAGLPAAKPVDLPHIWQSEPGLVNYCGYAWYSQVVHVDRSKNSRVHLCFEAVDYLATVWVNGQLVGEHEGGYCPFDFDVTDQLRFGEDNLIVVRVFDPEDNTEIPIGKQGSWYTRISGIWQGVYLESRNSFYIESVRIQPDIAKQSIKVDVDLKGSSEPTDSVTFEIVQDQDPTSVINSQSVQGLTHALQCTLDIPEMILWEPDHPHLYRLIVTVKTSQGQDQVEQIFGMREISCKDGHFLLNNKPLFIRGALDQSFYPDTIYYAPSDEYIINEIKLAKQMGFNLLRKHIKAEIPRYLEWADRMGLLIWAEAPNYIKWTYQSRTRFEQQLFDMVKRDFNHPSIIIWSIYNEEWGLEWDLWTNPEKQAFLAGFYDRLKTYDPSRLICDNSGWAHVKTDINDHHRYFTLPDQDDGLQKDLDDFVVGDPDRNFVSGIQANNQPIVISEFGVWGLPSVEKIREHYREFPWWFDNQGDDTHRESFKQPNQGLGKFNQFGLKAIFGTFENLALHSQKRMYRANQAIIENFRKRPEINGYVVTEFTDIEWETNGWLDYLRNPKYGFDKLNYFNDGLALIPDGVKHNLRSGETQTWNLILSNHDCLACEAVLSWRIEGMDCAGQCTIHLTGAPHSKLNQVVQFTAPVVETPQFAEMKLVLTANGQILAENCVELTISPDSAALQIPVYAYRLDASIVAQLEQCGFNLVDSFDQASVVLTNCLDSQAQAFARAGGKLVFLAEAGDLLEEKGQFTFRRLNMGEDWDRSSSMNYVDNGWFSGLPVQPEMGWEFEGIVPEYIIPFEKFSKPSKAGRPIFLNANGIADQMSTVISGYFQGWIGLNGGTLMKQHLGDGQLMITTWRLLAQLDTNPMASELLKRIVENINS